MFILCFADVTVLIASTEAGLQLLLNKVLTSSGKFELYLNAKKTKVLVVSKPSPEPTIIIMASNDKVQQVQSFNFLGLWITSDTRYEKEIKRRITLAKASFNNIKNIFRDHVLFYLPYLSSIYEKANCIAILWTGSPHSLGSCLFRGLWATCLPHKDGASR